MLKRGLFCCIFIFCPGNKTQNPNHLLMPANSNHIVFFLVVTKEEVKQQMIKAGKDPSNLHPAV